MYIYKLNLFFNIGFWPICGLECHKDLGSEGAWTLLRKVWDARARLCSHATSTVSFRRYWHMGAYEYRTCTMLTLLHTHFLCELHLLKWITTIELNWEQRSLAWIGICVYRKHCTRSTVVLNTHENIIDARGVTVAGICEMWQLGFY